MAFANRVLLLMNSAAFLQIAGVAATSGGGGGGGGTAPLRQPVGVPETIPDITFIANPLPSDNGFIASANEFHNNFGLAPIGVNSIEDILIRLQAASTPIRCMRIVTHADFNNLFLWLFNNGSRGIFAAPLAAFARSDADGLRALIPGGHFAGDSTDRLLQIIRDPTTRALLTPFGLDQPGSAVSAPMRTFLHRCLDFVTINPGTQVAPVADVNVQTFDNNGVLTSTIPITTAQRVSTQGAILLLLTDEARPLITGAVTDVHISALQTAVLSLTNNDLGFVATDVTNIQNLNSDTIDDLREATRAIAAGLRAKITHARARFSRTSRIDIRGCRVAQGGHTNLQAIQEFFGPAGNLPMVTGPNWLQSFSASYHTVFTSGIDALVSAGIPIEHTESDGTVTVIGHFSTSDINGAFADWRDQLNFGAFISFISGLMQGNPFDFTTLTWRQRQTTLGGPGIPVLNMEAHHVDDLISLALPALIERFRLYFDITTAMPNTAARTRLGSLQPRVATFAQIQQRVSVAAAPTPTDLMQFFNDLKTVYTALISVAGVTAPNPRLIPATAPSSLDLPTIQGYVTAIRGFIDTTLTTNYGTFFTDVSTALQGTNGGLKLYLSAGLPLLLQSASLPAKHTIMIHDPLKTQAMRNYLKLLWTGDASQVTTMNTRINALTFNWTASTEAHINGLMAKLRIPAVHEEHADTDPSGFAPTAAYNIHIVVESPTP